MTFLSQQGLLAQVGTYLKGPFGSLTHIRTATKRVSGSRTNKNDSAGRRLGPKAYENNFVEPGQIIMRQRGTKIHPGDNVGIGRDYTIFALEPGYVRFYLDPFHPLRKYVGVALTKESPLPKPHFEPRERRFGYNALEGTRAQQELERMSRKEAIAQPELQKKADKAASKAAAAIEQYTAALASLAPELGAEEARAGAERLHFIACKLRRKETAEFAAEQATFNSLHDLELAHRRGDLSAEELVSQQQKLTAFAASFDEKIAVDVAGKAYLRMSAEARSAEAAKAVEQLEQFVGKVLGDAEKQAIHALISAPGVFGAAERAELRAKYLPKVLPETVPGTVVKAAKGQKLPKNAVTVRTYNPRTRRVRSVVRTREAFL